MLSNLLLLLSIVGALIYTYFKRVFRYWEQRGLLTYPNPSVPLGHYTSPFNRRSTNMGIMLQEFYSYFKEKQQNHGGIYMLNTPIYLPVNLDIIKDIAIKHFEHFDEKGLFYNEELQPVSAHLFQIGGARWKKLRVKLSPTFTSGKMKMMFPSVVKCTESLLKSLKNEHQIDCKLSFGRFTTDVIGLCAFGIECDSFENTAFHYFGTRVFKVGTLRAASRNLQQFLPKVAKALRLLPFPKDAEEFFVKMIADTVKMREESELSRNDFIQLLIGLKNSQNPNEAITMQEVYSEGWIFFNAGFETSSTTLSFCLYELAKHEDIQELLRHEVSSIFEKVGGKLTYEALSELKYMQQVIDETMRMYPPLTILNRECSKDIKIDNVCLEKGTKVFIPAFAIHHDPKYYPNPETFNPGRFSEEEKGRRHPFAYLPFGGGPRICIGMRFAYMQIKIGLAHLLKEYKFTLDPSTTRTLSFDKSIILSPNEQLLLNFTKVSNDEVYIY